MKDVRTRPLFWGLIGIGLVSLVMFFPPFRELLLSVGGRFIGSSLPADEVHDIFMTNCTNSEIWFLCLIGFSLLFMCVDFTDIENNRRLAAGSLFMIIVFISVPLFFNGINWGHDGRFHMMRIAGIADELGRGHFPVRLQPLWLGGYGYPVSVYYGDILLYIPALLHLAGIPLSTAYKFYILAINAGTVIVSYLCFRDMFKSRGTGLLLSFVYASASYRLVCIFVRHAAGEYSAFMFFPIIALAFCNLYYRENVNIFKNAALLAVGMSALVLTHVLSTELAVFTLVIVCVVFFRKTFRLKNLACLLLAAAETALICAFFIVPFLDYFMNVPVNVSRMNPQNLAKGAVYPVQFLMFFQRPWGEDSAVLKERMLFSPGIPLVAGFIISVVYLIKVKRDSRLIHLLVLSCIALWLSSSLFPWDAVSNTSAGRILSQIQFAWRWLGIAMIFLTLLLGRLLSLYKNQNADSGSGKFSRWMMGGGYVCVVLINLAVFNIQYLMQDHRRYLEDYTSVGSDFVSGGEYLRTGTDLNDRHFEVEPEGVVLSGLTRNANAFSFHAESVQGGYVELPVFNYRGYRALLNDGQNLEITDGRNNVVRVLIPAEFNSDVSVSFAEPLIWKISSIVSLCTVLALIAVMPVISRREKKNERE